MNLFFIISIISLASLGNIQANAENSPSSEYVDINSEILKRFNQVGVNEEQFNKAFSSPEHRSFSTPYNFFKICMNMSIDDSDVIRRNMENHSINIGLDLKTTVKIFDTLGAFFWEAATPTEKEYSIDCNSTLWEIIHGEQEAHTINKEMKDYLVANAKFNEIEGWYPSCSRGDYKYDLYSDTTATEVAIQSRDKFVCSSGYIETKNENHDNVTLFINGRDLLCEQRTDKKRIEASKSQKGKYYIRGKFLRIGYDSKVILQDCDINIIKN